MAKSRKTSWQFAGQPADAFRAYLEFITEEGDSWKAPIIALVQAYYDAPFTIVPRLSTSIGHASLLKRPSLSEHEQKITRRLPKIMRAYADDARLGGISHAIGELCFDFLLNEVAQEVAAGESDDDGSEVSALRIVTRAGLPKKDVEAAIVRGREERRQLREQEDEIGGDAYV